MKLKPVILYSRAIYTCLIVGLAVALHAGEPLEAQPTNPVPAQVSNVPADSKPPAPPRQRTFAETDLLDLLTSTIQQEYVKDKGELELRLSRPWTSRSVPDEPLTINVLDMPPTGVTSSFITRFELRTAQGCLGTYQIALQARIWREVWVARSMVKRGELVADAAIEKERRDVLTLHEALADFTAGDTSLEMAEPLQAGTPLLARSVKLRPVIHRGQSADALVQDGALSITMKVEALEDGVPGQIIRARNSQSRRDIRGKVLNAKTILVSL